MRRRAPSGGEVLARPARPGGCRRLAVGTMTMGWFEISQHHVQTLYACRWSGRGVVASPCPDCAQKKITMLWIPPGGRCKREVFGRGELFYFCRCLCHSPSPFLNQSTTSGARGIVSVVDELHRCRGGLAGATRTDSLQRISQPSCAAEFRVLGRFLPSPSCPPGWLQAAGCRHQR